MFALILLAELTCLHPSHRPLSHVRSYVTNLSCAVVRDEFLMCGRTWRIGWIGFGWIISFWNCRFVEPRTQNAGPWCFNDTNDMRSPAGRCSQLLASAELRPLWLDGFLLALCHVTLHDVSGSQTYLSRYPNQGGDYVFLPSIFCVVKKEPVIIQNNIVVFVPRYPPKNRILAPPSLETTAQRIVPTLVTVKSLPCGTSFCTFEFARNSSASL